MALTGVAVDGRFSWTKGLLHALVPVVLVVAAACGAVFGGLAPQAAAVWKVAAVAAVLLLPAGLLASWLIQTDRRGCGVLLASGVVGVALVVALGLLASRNLSWLGRIAVRAEETEFETYWTAADGQRFRHPTLGFSFPSPSARFAEAPAVAEPLQAAMGRFAGTHAWAYEDGRTGERIILLLAKGPGETREEFESFTGSFKEEVLGVDGVSLLRDELRWDVRGDFLLQTKIHDRVHFEARCLGSGVREPVSYVFCLAASSASPTWARRYLAGLEAEEPEG